MIIGIVKELKEQENRVAITPAGVDTLTACGNHILIEKVPDLEPVSLMKVTKLQEQHSSIMPLKYGKTVN